MYRYICNSVLDINFGNDGNSTITETELRFPIPSGTNFISADSGKFDFSFDQSETSEAGRVEVRGKHVVTVASVT